ncbi:hypothetical protein O181_013975 [Austropuccinia psidii MF-1]|uniref:Uncharacterized protein n=1 Tax=Austropuccinia psidii MF-1 TaxID=1389203 RepID=A0A9Q3C038_9BASI|nr:hypothetical protein [Austropuccinia psidii MF-1]
MLIATLSNPGNRQGMRQLVSVSPPQSQEIIQLLSQQYLTLTSETYQEATEAASGTSSPLKAQELPHFKLLKMYDSAMRCTPINRHKAQDMNELLVYLQNHHSIMEDEHILVYWKLRFAVQWQAPGGRAVHPRPQTLLRLRLVLPIILPLRISQENPSDHYSLSFGSSSELFSCRKRQLMALSLHFLLQVSTLRKVKLVRKWPSCLLFYATILYLFRPLEPTFSHQKTLFEANVGHEATSTDVLGTSSGSEDTHLIGQVVIGSPETSPDIKSHKIGPVSSTNNFYEGSTSPETLRHKRLATARNKVEKVAQDNSLKVLIEREVGVLKAQDELIRDLYLEHVMVQDDLEVLLSEFRAAIVVKLQRLGPKAQTFLRQAKSILEEIPTRNNWVELLDEAERDYILWRQTSGRHFFLAIFQIPQRNSKKLDRLSVDVRTKISQIPFEKRTEPQNRALDLARAREVGLALSSIEKRLLRTIAEGRESQLTKADCEFIETLKGTNVALRRVEQSAELLASYADSEADIDKPIVSDIITALQALSFRSRKGTPWTKEQTQLFEKLAQLRNLKSVDRLLSPGQRKIILRLSSETRASRTRIFYQKALDSSKIDAKPSEEMLQLQIKLEKALNNKNGPMGTHLSEQEIALIKDYAIRHDLLNKKLNYVQSDLAIDTSRFRFSNRERKLKILSSSTETSFLAGTHTSAFGSKGFLDPPVVDFAQKVKEAQGMIDDDAKVTKVLSLLLRNKDQAPGFNRKAQHFGELWQNGHLGFKEITLKKSMLAIYNEILHSMTLEEKVFQYLKWKEEMRLDLSKEEQFTRNYFQNNGVLTFEDKFKVIDLSKFLYLPSVPERVCQWLKNNLKALYKNIFSNLNLWKKKLRFTPGFKFCHPSSADPIKKVESKELSTEIALSLPESRESRLDFSTNQRQRAYKAYDNHIYDHLTHPERRKLKILRYLLSTSPEPPPASTILKLVELLDMAEKRMRLDLHIDNPETFPKIKSFLEGHYKRRKIEKERLLQCLTKKRENLESHRVVVQEKIRELENLCRLLATSDVKEGWPHLTVD